MTGELVNGMYRVLGEMPDSPRSNVFLGHSLVTGELVLLCLESAGRLADALRREGQIFNGLFSPYVHNLLDYDADQGFLAWEYAPGWSLARVARSGRVAPLAWVIQTWSELAQGVGAVHAAGALYRAVEPSNILVTRDGRVKLLTTASAMYTNRSRLVEAGPPKNTPIHYLAPEQIDGGVDVRSDIYSLAAVAYELLTGQRLYSATDPVTLAVQILKTRPVSPSSLRPDVPPEMDMLFDLCLARDPDERPASVVGMLAHLRRLAEQIGDGGEAEAEVGADLRQQPILFPLMADDADDADIVAALAQPVDAHPELLVVSPAPVEHRLAIAAAEGVPAEAPETGPRPESLVWRLVASTGQVFALDADTVVIGRTDPVRGSPDVDLGPLDEKHAISRQHARLVRSNGGWRCLALAARNGTVVNGRPLREGEAASLASGDCLRLANLELTLEAFSSR